MALPPLRKMAPFLRYPPSKQWVRPAKRSNEMSSDTGPTPLGTARRGAIDRDRLFICNASLVPSQLPPNTPEADPSISEDEMTEKIV